MTNDNAKDTGGRKPARVRLQELGKDAVVVSPSDSAVLGQPTVLDALYRDLTKFNRDRARSSD